jgi:hypothetical protein
MGPYFIATGGVASGYAISFHSPMMSASFLLKECPKSELCKHEESTYFEFWRMRNCIAIVRDRLPRASNYDRVRLTEPECRSFRPKLVRISTAGTHSFCTADTRMKAILNGAVCSSWLSQDWSGPRMIGLGGK